MIRTKKAWRHCLPKPRSTASATCAYSSVLLVSCNDCSWNAAKGDKANIFLAIFWGITLTILIVMLIVGLYMTFTDFRDNPILTTFNIIQVQHSLLRVIEHLGLT